MIEDPRLYLVAPARLRAGALADLVPELAAAGVDMIQLRAKEAEAAELVRLSGPLVDACGVAGVPFIVNDRPDVAMAVGATGVHLGQEDLPVEAARRILPSGIIGRSTHSAPEIERAAADPRVDYFAVGPVYETPTKLGRPPVGLELVSVVPASTAKPWFAIGGIDASNLDAVLEAGARRVVVVRAVTEAPDPAAAAAGLKERLSATRL